ncbi:hypothetical protein NDK25_07500 [Niallia taxi]|nr:hypothetical protein [Niallia taxi]MDE5052255.1 hypothetical protein [Niallia taxi]
MGIKGNLSKGAVTSIFFAVFFVFVLWSGLGFVLLMAVDTDKTPNAINNAASSRQSAGTDSAKLAAVGIGTILATKREISTFVVQYGVHTTKTSAYNEFN